MHQLNLLKSEAEDALEKAKKTLERCRILGIRIITYDAPEYASNIRQYPDFPILFYAKGYVREDWTHGIGIVGARRCSVKGKNCAIQNFFEFTQLDFNTRLVSYFVP